MPPITPEPRIIIQNWCMEMPSAEISMPPHQHTAATTPALRGPARSSQPPQRAAAQPRNTKNRVYIQPSVAMLQSQCVANSSPKKPTPWLAQDGVPGAPVASAFDSGSQNTEKP